MNPTTSQAAVARPPASVEDHYDQHYYDQVLQRMLADDDYYQRKARCAERTYFGRFARPLGPVLEYGCGIGQNIARLPEAFGYDVSPAARHHCQRRGIPTLASPDQIPRGHFQYVLCRHVLEHLERPLDTVRELLAYLAPRGRLILVLPVERHAHVPLEPDLHRHLYQWNFRCLNNLVHAAGGVPLANRYEPMFGARTDRLLAPWLPRGSSVYYHLGRAAGRLLRQWELVVEAGNAER
ncbi:MAG: class I SAM-dependent methyltransferase [Pirellulaceae bacterium]|nr:class I SAM-dependent methyltransferase [Pirellulaceae bacterium]